MSDLFLPPFLDRRASELHMESTPLAAIAKKFGTPCYAYSSSAITEAYEEFRRAFSTRPALICYAVKANGNLSILRLLSRLGAGFDIVSAGELHRVLRAGGLASRIVFSGVGKSCDDMAYALKAGVRCFNVESEPELRRLSDIAQSLGVTAPVSLRVNPDVDPKTHPYIATGLKESKFGIAHDGALDLYLEAARLPGLKVTGIDCHIGSQITELSPFLSALDRILLLVERLKNQGIQLGHLDLGGGLGIRYRHEQPISLAEYAREICSRLDHFDGELILEPGRRLVGNSGVLLTRVEYIKRTPGRSFAIVDAAMNDLVRPALYDAWHEILPVCSPATTGPSELFDVVGPVCETGDILGRDRTLALAQGDLLCILSAGAYAASMGSNYNARPRPPEVLVEGNETRLIRRRETLDELSDLEWPID